MNPQSRVWEILEHSSVGMLTTRFSGGLRARPLDARPARKVRAIYFVIDVRGLKDDEIQASPDVGFTTVDHKNRAYLSITGTAEVLRDHTLAQHLWKKSDSVWWPKGP
ncbi:MAG TPA: pyridoxamine 5'-phosphate oxidase family protein [Pseudolabrys sp.]|nr:pyridoxamine 5'-phosphate oxidase family protein [Pseudolabrys sp.]